MRFKYVLILLLTLSKLVCLSQKKIDKLIEDKQYLTAWQEIEKLPRNTENLKVLTNFVLTYFTLSKEHQQFSFNNLNDTENLIEKRYTENPNTAIFFAIPLDTILLTEIKKSPKNGDLYLCLGNYYYEVFLLYKKNWLVNRQELMRLFNQNYSKAHEFKKYSDKSYYGLGFFEMINGNKSKSIEYFEKSYEINPKNINSLHQLAVLYSEIAFQSENDPKIYENAINYSKKTLETFPPTQGKYLANMAFTIGNLYYKKNNLDSAIVYYILSNTYLPESTDILQNLLVCFVQKNRWTEAKVTTTNLLNLEIKDVILFQNILSIYESVDAQNQLIENLKYELSYNNHNKERTAYLKLYLANVYFSIDKQIAKDWLVQSETDFLICYDKDHPVFLNINKLNSQLNK